MSGLYAFLSFWVTEEDEIVFVHDNSSPRSNRILSLLFLGGNFLIALLSYIEDRNKKHKK